MTSLMEKSLAKNEFFCSKSETDFEKRFFLKTCFSKKIQCTHKMKCSLDNLAEICSPEVRETFLSEVGKGLKNYSFYFLGLTQSVSLDSVGAIMLNLPINICHCLGIFPSSSGVIYSSFFTSENLWTVSLDKKNSVFSTLPAFLPKVRHFFADRCELYMKL